MFVFLSQFTADDLEVNQQVEVKYGHGKTTYQAKIMQIEPEDKTVWVHYLGWNNRYDEWIEISKIIRIFDDNSSNKRRKPAKPLSQTTTSSSSRSRASNNGVSSNDSDTKSSFSSSKKPLSSKKEPHPNDTPKTSSSSSKRSSNSSQSSISLSEQAKDEETTPSVVTQSTDNLLSIKEEALDAALNENVFEEPVVCNKEVVKEDEEEEKAASPQILTLDSIAVTQPAPVSSDFSLEEFITKPANLSGYVLLDILC